MPIYLCAERVTFHLQNACLIANIYKMILSEMLHLRIEYRRSSYLLIKLA